MGGGPFHAPLSSPLYPNAVYYASQCIADATCAVSLDGGITFGPSTPMYTIADCAGLHGHLKVGPDGTVYVPNKSCGSPDGVAVVVSEDNGLTWVVRNIPNSPSMGDDDPSVVAALDAICFALYGTVPRWGGTRGLANALAPSATEARVRLVFESAGDRYVATRVVRRDGRGTVKTANAGLQLLPPGFDVTKLDTGLSDDLFTQRSLLRGQ